MFACYTLYKLCLEIDTMKFLSRNDRFLIIIIIFIIIALYLIRFCSSKTDGTVEIYVNNELYTTCNINNDNVIDIYIDDVLVNIVKVKNGYASMEYASCPDRLCVKQAKICYSNEAICCLPNKVLITVKNEDNSEYDAITQ